MQVFDYYSGFEGEPEILISQKNKDGKAIALLRIWVAYFDKIISLIPPNGNGCWEGISLHYHSVTGFYDTSWECQDIILFRQQLESIDEELLKKGDAESIEKVSFEVLSILKSMLKDTIDSDGKIMIEYD